AGSLAGGALTDVSPVNGFLYSLTGVITSMVVGLYPAGAGAAELAAAGVVEGAVEEGAGAGAGDPAEPCSGAPGLSLSDMCVVVMKRRSGRAGRGSSRGWLTHPERGGRSTRA